MAGAQTQLATAAHSGPVQAGAEGLRVRQLQDDDGARWDAFVASCPQATFFHRAGWAQVIRQAFGHETLFLMAERDGEIEGVLPLARIRSWLFGHSLISLPFCVYGGIAARSAPAAQALDSFAREQASALGVDHLEYRHRDRQFHPEWPGKDLYATFRKVLEPDPEANLQAIPRKQRRMVRQGIKAELRSDWSDDQAGLDAFFDLYARSVHRLGTPVFPRRYFMLLREVFGDDCRVLTVSSAAGEPVSGVLTFFFRDEVLPYYGGGAEAARRLAGYDFLYWELMRRSCAAGYRMFDFGRSKRDTGAYHFKRNWGFEPQTLAYEYGLFRASAVPDHNPLNPRYQRAIRMWQRLPLPLANFLGPWVVRNLG